MDREDVGMEREGRDGEMEERSTFNLCFAELSGSCHRAREAKKRDGDE